jgi:hypothetical protein
MGFMMGRMNLKKTAVIFFLFNFITMGDLPIIQDPINLANTKREKRKPAQTDSSQKIKKETKNGRNNPIKDQRTSPNNKNNHNKD